MSDLIVATEETSRESVQDLRIEVFGSCYDIRELWQSFESEACCYGFQSFIWISAILETVGRGGQMRQAIVVVFDRRNVPLMLMPLMVRRHYGVTRMEFIDFGLADYNAPLIRRDFVTRLADSREFSALWQRIANAVGPVDAVYLDKMPERIETLPNPFLQLSCRLQEMSFQAPLEGDFDSFLKQRSKGLMADSRAKRRRLARQGPVTFQIATDPADVDRFIEAMIGQKSQRYQSTGMIDRFRSPAYGEFYRVISRREGVGGIVQVSALTMHDKVVAVHFGMVFRDRFYWLMPAFDSDLFGRFSPGRLLLLDLLSWCFKRKLTLFDFTIGSERYKLDWAKQTMPLYCLAEGISLRGRAQVLGRALYRRLKTAIQERQPHLFATLKSWRARILNRGRQSSGQTPHPDA